MLPSELSALAAGDRDRLLACLDDWRDWASESPTVISLLGNGLTNRSYLLKVGGQRLVLRVNTGFSEALGLPRQVEATIIRRAARAGISPALVYEDPQGGYMISKFCAGRQWQAKHSGSDQGIQQLADMLRRIHQLPAVTETLDIQNKARYYWKSLHEDSALAKQLKPMLPTIQSRLAAVHRKKTPPRLCHNDLLAANILSLQDGPLIVLDWEYAAMGDTYFDLATVVEGHGLSEPQAMHLLQAYLGYNIGSEQIEHLTSMRIAYCYLSLLWYGAKSPRYTVGMTVIDDQFKALNRLLCDAC